MTNIKTGEQIENWKAELTSAMTDQKWRRALQLCSWLRYALDQQGHSDPEIEQMHSHAKEALAEQVKEKQDTQERQRKLGHLRRMSRSEIASGQWLRALDTIEAYHDHGASQEEVVDVLQALQDRLSRQLAFTQRPAGIGATEIKQRFNTLLQQIRDDS